jgi:serine/threonine-protein kinase
MLESRKCPQCNETYPHPTESCPNDGQQLEAPTNTLVGKVLGNYRIDSVLGVGGMGAVYRATHLLMESEFAVKVLHPELVERESSIERFRREAIAAQRIRHENAVEVTDFGVTAEKWVYLVMRIVEGRPLRDLIKEKVFDYRRAVEILCQVCAAIDKAHHCNIIHRDIKPDNIFVQQAGFEDKVKVMDFGIAKLLEPPRGENSQRVLTRPGLIIGTPQYMSPEQCLGKELEPSSDIYSLGLVAYEMLSGVPPFLAGNQMEYISKHLHETPTPLSHFVPNIPPSLERVVMRALEKEPTQRYASAEEFARELRKAVREAEGRPTNPAPVITEEIDRHGNHNTTLITGQKSFPVVEIAESKTQQPAKHKMKWRVAVTGVVVTALILGTGIYFALTRKVPPPPVNNVGVILRDSIKDRFGDEMRLIRGGTLRMGDNDGDDDERPEHSVPIPPFYMDICEVANFQYKRCVDEAKCRPPKNWKGGDYSPEEALMPVTHITWDDAVNYATWIEKRLPTEEEWEYAARSGEKGFRYPWGPQWITGSANVDRGESTSTVPSSVYDRNEFGVFDLAGNVSEWVDSDYLRYVTKEPIQTCLGCKVYRGGNFIDEIKESRATKRWGVLPGVTRRDDADIVFPKVGFRCVRDVPVR